MSLRPRQPWLLLHLEEPFFTRMSRPSTSLPLHRDAPDMAETSSLIRELMNSYMLLSTLANYTSYSVRSGLAEGAISKAPYLLVNISEY